MTQRSYQNDYVVEGECYKTISVKQNERSNYSYYCMDKKYLVFW